MQRSGWSPGNQSTLACRRRGLHQPQEGPLAAVEPWVCCAVGAGKDQCQPTRAGHRRPRSECPGPAVHHHCQKGKAEDTNSPKVGAPSPVAWETSLGLLKVTAQFPPAVLSASFTNYSALASKLVAPKQGRGRFKCALLLCLDAQPQSYRICNSRDNTHPPKALSL